MFGLASEVGRHFCFAGRSDNQSVRSSDEETDDTEPLDHDYNLPQVKIKKFINRGKWSKEEVFSQVVFFKSL